MSNSKVLRRCHNPVQAEALRTRLDAEGILAVIDGAEAHLMMSYIGTALGGVKVRVAPEDYDRAVALLVADESKAASTGPWICSRCREHNDATFELCWQCQEPRVENDQPGDPEASSEQPLESATDAAAADVEDRNPYRPILLPKHDRPTNRDQP